MCVDFGWRTFYLRRKNFLRGGIEKTMRKKKLLILVAILAAICASVALSGCGLIGGGNGSNGGNGNGGTGKPSGEYTEVAEIEYELSVDETYYIVKGVKTKTCTEAVIPSTHNEKPVEEIGVGAFYECNSLMSVTIPKSVTSIGRSAFYGCYLLTSMTIPDSVTSIGGGAFLECRSLTSVIIGNGVTSIEEEAFYNCTSLKGVYITDIAAWCNIEFGDNPLYYAHNLYLNNELVTDLVIPDRVRSIGSSAFGACYSLTSITIPDSVTSIGGRAFVDCCLLTSITIGSGVTDIGKNAFYYCSKLVEVINKSNLEIVQGSDDYGGVGYYALTVHSGESKIVNKDGYFFITDDGINYLLGYKGNEIELTLPENYNGEWYEI